MKAAASCWSRRLRIITRWRIGDVSPVQLFVSALAASESLGCFSAVLQAVVNLGNGVQPFLYDILRHEQECWAAFSSNFEQKLLFEQEAERSGQSCIMAPAHLHPRSTSVSDEPVHCFRYRSSSDRTHARSPAVYK